MNAIGFLRANVKWQFNKQPFIGLIYPSATPDELRKTLDALAEKYYPQAQAVDVLQTEFALNRVALSRADTDERRLAKSRFGGKWLTFCRLKRVFGRAGAFPANGDGVRIMQIARAIAKCTQFCISGAQARELLDYAEQAFDLTEREQRHLPHALELCSLQHYAAAYFAGIEGSIARAICPTLLGVPLPNDNYRQAAYRTPKIAVCVNCLGNAVVQIGDVTLPDKAVLIYAEGKNVFDTFCSSRLGEKTASFFSETRTTRLAMQLFVSGNRVVRRYDLTNKSARNRTFTVDVPFECAAQDYFELQNAGCACTKNIYTAVALVVNNQILPLSRNATSLGTQVFVKKGEQAHFDVVTAYSTNIADISDCLAELQRYGATRCPHATDRPHPQVMQGEPLTLTPQSNQKRYELARPNGTRYTRRLGDCNVATLADDIGNTATLLRGFPFTSEYVFSIKNGQMTPLNVGKPTANEQAICYENGTSRCVITHANGAKIVSVSSNAPTRHLFLLTLARKSKIGFDGSTFTVEDGLRSYTIKCSVPPQSITTNGLECNPCRLRYKLSGNMQTQTCLAFCLPKTTDFTMQIAPADTVPQPTPLLKESLLSTCLGYVNEKTTFSCRNRLTRHEALSVAALCYTNPRFVYKYLTESHHNGTFQEYYYSDSILQKVENPLLLALCGVYYMRLRHSAGTSESEQPPLPEQMLADIQRILLTEFGGTDLCVKALALKRACGIAPFDNACCATEYARIKKLISGDSTLYAYAQAIGAVPLVNPCKQRLKDLCNSCGIPKGWYYVSQLENLYGMNYHNGRLSFAPSCTAEQLEGLALELDGKRIDASFLKAATQSMTLNGVTHFLPFCPASLRQQTNTLVVRY